jgi:hypothetical protein
MRVGTIYVSKNKGQSDYLQFKLPEGVNSITFNNGDKVQVETKQFKINSIKQGMAEGRLDAETGNKMLDQAGKMPDFVRAELVLLKKRA